MADIKFNKNHKLVISKNINDQWLVKIPTSRHRLSRSGTVGLDMVEMYKLQNKLGILYIDMSIKSYVFIPKDILDKYQPEGKTYSGVKNAIFSYPIKTIIKDHNLELSKIKINDSKRIDSNLVDTIRGKFGL